MLQSEHDDDRELIKGVEFERDKSNNVKLASIVRRIVSMGFPVKDNLISYYSITDKLFVFAGREPLGEEVTIPSDDIDVG